MDNDTIVEKIYFTPSEELHDFSSDAIDDACNLLNIYAKKIVEITDVSDKRWILVNLINKLYKDVFLLQTKDFEEIVQSDPKNLKERLSDRCFSCNRELTHPIDLGNVDEQEKVRALCLNCFIDTVKHGEWFDESSTRLQDIHMKPDIIG